MIKKLLVQLDYFPYICIKFFKKSQKKANMTKEQGNTILVLEKYNTGYPDSMLETQYYPFTASGYGIHADGSLITKKGNGGLFIDYNIVKSKLEGVKEFPKIRYCKFLTIVTLEEGEVFDTTLSIPDSINMIYMDSYKVLDNISNIPSKLKLLKIRLPRGKGDIDIDYMNTLGLPEGSFVKVMGYSLLEKGFDEGKTNISGIRKYKVINGKLEKFFDSGILSRYELECIIF